MKRAALFVIALTVTVPLAAQEKNKAKGRKGDSVAAAFELPKGSGIELSDEQKKKVEELKKEYGPKLKEAQEKVDGLLSADQRKAQEDARRNLKKEGKDRKDARAAIEESLKLTDEQKKTYVDANKSVAELQKTIRTKMLDLLTAEQKSKIKGERKKEAKTAR